MKPLEALHGSDTTCTETRSSFSAYLDGAVNGHQMQAIGAHLEDCAACDAEFSEWRAVQQTLASLRHAKAPADLGLRLRLAISREGTTRRIRWQNSLSLFWENTLRPFALQGAAGLACAITLIGGIVLLLGVVPPPNAVLANDEPLGAITAPHYLYSVLRPQPIMLGRESGSSAIVVEAQISSEGRVYDYTVVSAPESLSAPATRNQIVEQLLLSVFKPASVFGTPVKSRVVLTFTGVRLAPDLPKYSRLP